MNMARIFFTGEIMLTGNIVRLYPTPEQAAAIRQSAGACRFLYNRLLEHETDVYKREGRFVSEYELNAYIRKLKDEYPWLKDVNSQSLQQVSNHLANAFNRFFRKKAGFPRYIRKHSHKDSFSNPQHCSLDFPSSCISIPKIGKIKAVFHRRLIGQVRSITVKIDHTGDFYASILMDDGKEKKEMILPDNPSVLGVDIGIKDLAVCSDGTVFHNPHFAKKYEKILRKRQKALSRKEKDSRNREKARRKAAKIHKKISACRSDYINKVTYRISESQADVIAIEDIHVKGMLRNHKLASAVSDASFREFRRQLEYKCERNGKLLIVIPRFAKTTQACSSCGYVNADLKGFKGLSIRNWICPGCGMPHDRDINAAEMIAKLGRDSLPRVTGDVKPVETASVDGRSGTEPKKHAADLKEAGKVPDSIRMPLPKYRKV